MKNKDRLFFAVVILCLISVVILFLYMKGQGGQCVKNPFVYGASKMGNIECNCIQHQADNPCSPTFSFSDTGFKSTGNSCKDLNITMNFTI
jgi:hypothetical protein